MFLHKDRKDWLNRQVAQLNVSAQQYPGVTVAVLALLLEGGECESFDYGSMYPQQGQPLFVSCRKERKEWGFGKWVKDAPQSNLEAALLVRQALPLVANQLLANNQESPLVPGIMSLLLEDVDNAADCLLIARRLLFSADPSLPIIADKYGLFGSNLDGSNILPDSGAVFAFLTRLHEEIDFSDRKHPERKLSPAEAMTLGGVATQRAHHLLMVELDLNSEGVDNLDSDLLSIF